MAFDMTYIRDCNHWRYSPLYKKVAVRFSARRIFCRQYALLLLLLPTILYAHVILSATELDDTLEQMLQLKEQLEDPATGSPRPEAIFALGREATVLADLLSKEFGAHGEQQRPLLKLAVQRAAELEINIKWSSEHQRYYYDGSAFRRYLKLAPRGPFAADSSFRLVQHEFYYSDERDHVSLVEAALRKKDFLTRFPDFGDVAKVGIYLGIDYRDIWRHCRELGDQVCVDRYGELTRGQLRQVTNVYAGTTTSEIAARMLLRFEKELAATTIREARPTKDN